MTVADTIISQSRATDHWALGAWGAHALDKTPDTLYMLVRGPRFAGKVGVHYHYPSDTYIVRAYQKDATTGEVVVVKEKENAIAAVVSESMPRLTATRIASRKLLVVRKAQVAASRDSGA